MCKISLKKCLWHISSDLTKFIMALSRGFYTVELPYCSTPKHPKPTYWPFVSCIHNTALKFIFRVSLLVAEHYCCNILYPVHPLLLYIWNIILYNLPSVADGVSVPPRQCSVEPPLKPCTEFCACIKSISNATTVSTRGQWFPKRKQKPPLLFGVRSTALKKSKKKNGKTKNVSRWVNLEVDHVV